MTPQRLRVWLAAGVAALALPTPGRAADEDAPPRPGQARRVLAALKSDGGTLARGGADWLLRREFPGQLIHLATDARGGMGGGGWYRPSQVRHGWEWLRREKDRDGDGAVTLAEFGGPREWFEALDRDRDGTLTKDDFDWATGTPLAAANSKATALFNRVDRDGNGQATADEWKLWFDALSGRKGYVSQDDLFPLFLDPKRPAAKGPAPAKSPAAAATRLAVVCSYLSGDVGSPSEGPDVGELAPRFTLLAADGKQKVSLNPRGGKPLVLIFGSLT